MYIKGTSAVPLLNEHSSASLVPLHEDRSGSGPGDVYLCMKVLNATAPIIYKIAILEIVIPALR